MSDRLRETCKECGVRLVTQRKDAEFCTKRCSDKWHYKARKKRQQSGLQPKYVMPARRRSSGSRRASRDGKGAHVYLSPTELRVLSEARNNVKTAPDQRAWMNAQVKLARAMRRKLRAG